MRWAGSQGSSSWREFGYPTRVRTWDWVALSLGAGGGEALSSNRAKQGRKAASVLWLSSCHTSPHGAEAAGDMSWNVWIF